MRFQLSFALVSLLAVACTTDDGGIGENEKKVDNATPGAEDASRAEPKLDASPAKQDAAATSDDAAVTGEDDAGETVVEDASLGEDDAGSVETDAGSVIESDAGTVNKRCGTRGGITCKGNEFCDFGGDPLCGATDKGGVCTPLPKPTKELDYVCGCDKRTYANPSTANAAGVSVMHKGSCTPAECTAAGGEIVASNGASIPACKPNQESWALIGLEPVLCCLGKVKEPIDPNDPGICGGFAGVACAKGQFCNYALGDGCLNIADGAGKCQEIPGGCIALYDPVCGCDGKTYSNGCVANQSGVSVKFVGACK